VNIYRRRHDHKKRPKLSTRKTVSVRSYHKLYYCTGSCCVCVDVKQFSSAEQNAVAAQHSDD